MSRTIPPLSPEAQACLASERALLEVPSATRLRVVERARLSLHAVMPVAGPAPGAAAPRPWWSAPAPLAGAAAAVVGGAIAVTVAVTASAPGNRGGEPLPPAARSVLAPGPRPAPASLSLDTPTPALPSSSAPGEPAPRVRGAAAAARAEPVRAELAREELRLLGQARAAVARGDFGAALPLLGEHERRFKSGGLVEEREALRVRALVGLGRVEAAEKAAASFKARFPRSVLLPAVSRLVETGP